ncbi:MAG: hypothetical protein NC078_00065 [Ruminococcus sp.]|nr:hypothetical protein [Ruminococcus sp.]
MTNVTLTQIVLADYLIIALMFILPVSAVLLAVLLTADIIRKRKAKKPAAVSKGKTMPDENERIYPK